MINSSGYRLKRLARNKHFTFFIWIIGDKERKFVNIDARDQFYKQLMVVNNGQSKISFSGHPV
jgi:hypothetical protein